MRQDCTEAFRHYREITRAVWNLGFCVKRELCEWDCVLAYREAMARLFEAMVLIPLGFGERVSDYRDLGGVASFSVVANSELVGLLIDRNIPGEPAHAWAASTPVGPLPCSLKFIEFFDWSALDRSEFRLLRVGIERMDEKPELVGRHALIDLSECTVWADVDSEAEDS